MEEVVKKIAAIKGVSLNNGRPDSQELQKSFWGVVWGHELAVGVRIQFYYLGSPADDDFENSLFGVVRGRAPVGVNTRSRLIGGVCYGEVYGL